MLSPTELLALGVAWLAAIVDLRTRRVPNGLTLGAALVALVLPLALGLWRGVGLPSAELASALEGAGLLLACSLPLSFAGLLGFGDSKLLGALGLCVGREVALRLLPCALLAGGVLALGLALARGELASVLRNLGRLGQLGAERVDEQPRHLHLFPFASAIALGTTWAVIGRHVPVIAAF